jgi:hypothetical protein
MQGTEVHFLIVLFGSLAVFNLANLVILNKILKGDLAGLLSEKGPVVQTANASQSNPSYSRLTGLIGGVILAIFLWAFGNVVIYLSLTDPDRVSDVLSSVGSYFLAGSALFAPYAFNQLRTSFNPTAAASPPQNQTP